jgi:hypothetical protein
MADPREAITNHLTPHGVRLEQVGGRGTADLSEILGTMDYAAVLGMIGARPAAMLLAKYAADGQEERKARAYWLMECIEHGAAKGWKRPGARMVESMAYASIDEHMGYGTRCAMCMGTKQRVVGHQVIECPQCQGAGFVAYSPDAYAELIGISLMEWDHTWQERIGWARRALHRWEMDAVESLMERMG